MSTVQPVAPEPADQTLDEAMKGYWLAVAFSLIWLAADAFAVRHNWYFLQFVFAWKFWSQFCTLRRYWAIQRAATTR